MQFIATELVEAAMSDERDPPVTPQDPLVMGVDVAHYSDDASVICLRRGRDARDHRMGAHAKARWILWRPSVQLKNQYKPDAIFVDGDGLGGPVVDQLREIRVDVFAIKGNGKADRGSVGEQKATVYANKRAQMWGTMRKRLAHGAIPAHPDLLHGSDRARIRLPSGKAETP